MNMCLSNNADSRQPRYTKETKPRAVCRHDISEQADSMEYLLKYRMPWNGIGEIDKINDAVWYILLA